MGFAELLAEFKKKMQASGMKYSDKELQAAVLKAINGVYIYDFGSSDGASHKFLNISPTMPKS
jgi:ATP adenylyltransferase/5',5'''-P-1,P-4-tetraphosphate phosphorylase II